MTVIGRSLSRGYGLQETAFSDASAIPSWALSHINYLTALGIVDAMPTVLLPPPKVLQGRKALNCCLGYIKFINKISLPRGLLTPIIAGKAVFLALSKV
jgi:hypothetical protein